MKVMAFSKSHNYFGHQWNMPMIYKMFYWVINNRCHIMQLEMITQVWKLMFCCESESSSGTDDLSCYARFADYPPLLSGLEISLEIKCILLFLYLFLFFKDECIWNPIEILPLRQKWIFRDDSSTFQLLFNLFQSKLLKSLTSSKSHAGLWL